MRLFSDQLLDLAAQTVADLRRAGRRMTTAESCTGGMITAVVTEVSGASDVLGRGFVVYSNNAKMTMLGVPDETLRRFGAVSDPTVRAMAEGALAASKDDADIAVGVSGIAGPGGGTPEKPVGTVYIGVAGREIATTAQHHVFGGDRTRVRLLTVAEALGMIRRAVQS